jgi:hypothetical protein
MIKLTVDNPADLDKLMDAAAYGKIVHWFFFLYFSVTIYETIGNTYYLYWAGISVGPERTG